MQPAATPFVYPSSAATILDPLFPSTLRGEPPRELDPQVRAASDLELRMAIAPSSFLLAGLVGQFAAVLLIIGAIYKADNREELICAASNSGMIVGWLVSLYLTAPTIARWARAHRAPAGPYAFGFGRLALGLLALFLGGSWGLAITVDLVVTAVYAAVRSRTTQDFCLAELVAHNRAARRVRREAYLPPSGFWDRHQVRFFVRYLFPLVVRPRA